MSCRSSWAPIGVQTHRRLVHEQNGRVGEQPAGDVEPLLHAPRVLLHFPVGVRRQPHLLQVKVGAATGLPRAHVVERCEVAQVLPAGQAAVEAAVSAEDEPDLPSDLRCLPDHVVPQHPGLSPWSESEASTGCGSWSSSRRRWGPADRRRFPPGDAKRQVRQGHGLPPPSPAGCERSRPCPDRRTRWRTRGGSPMASSPLSGSSAGSSGVRRSQRLPSASPPSPTV